MLYEETLVIRGKFRLASSINAMRRTTANPQSQQGLAELHFSHEVEGGAVEVLIRQQNPHEDISLKIYGNSANPSSLSWIKERVTRMLSLNMDGGEFYELVNDDPRLRMAAAICPDLRPVMYATPYEGIMTSILRKGLDMKQSVQLIRNFCEVGGIVPAGKPSAPSSFPGKFTLLALPDKLMEVIGLPEEKIRTARDFTSHLVGDPDPLEYLETVFDAERAIKTLTALPGINTMTGMHLLQYAYGHPDMVLDGPRLRMAIKRFYNLPDIPDSSTVKRLSEPFNRWRSWWTFLLITANETSVIV
jgi:DNA-3-methyladenine glycosylase II